MSKMIGVVSLVLGCSLVLALGGEAKTPWTRGAAELTSIGPLAFGPDGVLFAADPRGAALFAFDLGAGERGTPGQVEVEELDAKLAALLGTTKDDVLIEDLAVRPEDGCAYLSVTRGRGDDSAPVLVRVGDEGALELVALDDVRFARAELPNAPMDVPGTRRNPRTQSITDLAYAGGRVFVAGLSNEEFASKLRSVPYPFDEVERGASVEIYHGNHAAVETRAPVRTFVPYEIEGEPYLLAAYTCTPLVKFPLDALKDGAKVRGTTVAELGGGNSPLDMVTYAKDGQDWLLIANTRHGLMKVDASQLADAEPIEAPVTAATAGVTFERVDYLPGVEQLAKLDDDYVVVLMRDPDTKASYLVTIENP